MPGIGSAPVANALIDGDLPPRWGIERATSSSGGRGFLRIGQRRIALEEIEVIQPDEARERPIAGLLLGAIGFLVSAAIIAYLVLDQGWRQRYLIASSFLAFLAIAGLAEIFKAKPQSFFQIKIHTRTQGVVTFASADAREVEAFLAALAAAGVKRG